MTKLVILRGLPGCGKSTRARAWVEKDPDKRAEVNRDAIRLMLGGYTVGTTAQEKMVTKIQHNAIRDLLKSGVDVVSSDTNLQDRYMRELFRIANSVGAEIEVWDMTDIPLDVVRERNRYRQDKAPVPEMVVNRMYKGIRGKGYPLPVPDMDSAGKAPDMFVPVPGTPAAVISDIDGTVASCEGVRSPYDYSRVKFDRPRKNVIDQVKMNREAGRKIICVSGRPDSCWDDTRDWLDWHVGGSYELFMRKAGDSRNDAIVKREIFDDHIRQNYDVRLVLDDRDRVVEMWRKQLGLDCLQVNYGDF